MIGLSRWPRQGVRSGVRTATAVDALFVDWLGWSPLSLLAGSPVLVLWTTGRRTGRPKRTVVAYRARPDGTMVVAGGAFGRRDEPDWVRNLRANPAVMVKVRRRTVRMLARVTEAAERFEVWGDIRGVMPYAERFERRAGYEIAVVVLEPLSARADRHRIDDRAGR